ncbi:MAG: helix-turn-helix transcriptional regulator [Rhodospirillales bacterium]
MPRRSSGNGPDPIDKYVGCRVRARRIGRGMSQKKLSQVLGLAFQQIQKYENGSNRISASNLYKIAKALNIGVAFFFEAMPESALKASPPRGPGLADRDSARFEPDPMISRQTIQLTRNFCRIGDPRLRKRVLAFVKILADSF